MRPVAQARNEAVFLDAFPSYTFHMNPSANPVGSMSTIAPTMAAYLRRSLRAQAPPPVTGTTAAAYLVAPHLVLPTVVAQQPDSIFSC